MRPVEEVHGLFQFTDDFFTEEEEEAEASSQPQEQRYDGRYLAKHWFMSDATLDFNVAKHQIDLLYAQAQYAEAYQVALASYEHHGQKMPRELLEILVEVCIHLKQVEQGDQFMAEILRIGAQDPSIKWLHLRMEMAFERWERALEAGLDYLAFRPHEYRVCLRLHEVCSNFPGQESRAQEFAREAATIKHNYVRNLK